MKTERKLARLMFVDVGVEDHGCLYLDAQVEYESGGSQGIGRVFDPQYFGALVFAVVGLVTPKGMTPSAMLRNVRGVPVWVTCEDGGIVRLEPIFAREGRPLDFREESADYFRTRTSKVHE